MTFLLALILSQTMQPAPPPAQVCENAAILDMLAARPDIADRCDVKDALLKDILHYLREPVTDGTYRYAAPDPASPVEHEESFRLDKMQDSGAKITGKNIFKIVLKAPDKRSLFSDNYPVTLKEMVIQGDTHTQTIALDRVLEPGDNWSHSLGGIRENLTVIVKAVALEGKKKKTKLRVILVEAGLTDSRSNPFFELVELVKQLQSTYSITSDRFRDGLDVFRTYCTNDMRRELAYIDYLLGGNRREQEEARRRLKALLDTIH